MKNLFLDTNIIIDLLAKRPLFWDEASQIFSLGDLNKVKLSISALTFANANYIHSKTKSLSESRKALRAFKILVTIFPLDNKIIELSLNDESFKDFEDGLHYYTALQNNQNVILSRNLKDFKSSQIPTLTPTEYLKTFHY